MSNLNYAYDSKMSESTYNVEMLNKIGKVPLTGLPSKTLKNSIIAGTMFISFAFSSNITPTINPFFQKKSCIVSNYSIIYGNGIPEYKAIENNQDNCKIAITVLSDGSYSYNITRKCNQDISYNEFLGGRNMKRAQLNSITNNKIQVAGLLGKKLRNSDIEINERRHKEESQYVKVVASTVYAGDMPKKKRIGG